MNAALMTWCAPRYTDRSERYNRHCCSAGAHPSYYLAFTARWLLCCQLQSRACFR